ncbi:hypothetical protein ACQR1W_24075 [Bradyrhizobium sp. HKCCYLS1011]|uniref:hypothetical protein n=1 Tax=Bradyrhizobium sp. HKCCYLS1011 TaxID=3420733 RepID=UPI003EBD7C55
MSNVILNYGPPPLTEEAADAALDLIDFIAAQVRGVDLIDVTPTVRPLWRQHLAGLFQQLPPWTRNWYANAPLLLATTRAQWPLLDPMLRSTVLQQWANELPAMLWMLEPVLAQAQQFEHQQQQLAQVLDHIAQMRVEMMKSVADNMREEPVAEPRGPTAPTPAPAQADQAASERAAINELERMRNASHNLGVGMVKMTNATIGLMNAMSGRVRIG